MQITVKAYALLQERIGRGEIILNMADGATVRQLIDVLEERCGEGIAKMVLTPSGGLDPDVLVSHNGKRLTSAGAPLSEGDLVLFLSPMPGG